MTISRKRSSLSQPLFPDCSNLFRSSNLFWLPSKRTNRGGRKGASMNGVTKTTWNITIAKRDLIDAIGTARRRATLKRKGFELEKDVIFAASADGLSIRSSNAAMD